MSKYIVRMCRYYETTVEAMSEEDAMEKAHNMATSDWNSVDYEYEAELEEDFEDECSI